MALEGCGVEASAEGGAGGQVETAVVDAFGRVNEVGAPGALVDAELERHGRGHGGGDVGTGQDGDGAAGAVQGGSAALAGHQSCRSDGFCDPAAVFDVGHGYFDGA